MEPGLTTALGGVLRSVVEQPALSRQAAAVGGEGAICAGQAVEEKAAKRRRARFDGQGWSSYRCRRVEDLKRI
jgi:hypothetical protein